MAFTTRPTLSGSFGMVSSTHYLATATAMSVLERGGNAVDASVAGAFVLHVVEPHLNGPGGDAPILVSIRGGEPRVLCGQGPAPAGASAQAYRDLGLDLVPGTGPLAAAVPGAVDAWLTLLRDEGTWELADVLDLDLRVCSRLVMMPDFAEGVRAQLVDKDRNPHWTHASLADVSRGEVEALFDPI